MIDSNYMIVDFVIDSILLYGCLLIVLMEVWIIIYFI